MDYNNPLVIVAIVAGVLLLILILYAASVYNGLVILRNAFKNAFSQIDVQLKRRYDLIPNLVETVKGYMQHEKGTLEAVIQARNSAANAGVRAAANPGDPSAMGQLNAAEATLNGSLGRMFALAEAYPDLKANQNMLGLQEELSTTENKISFARQAYNDAVTSYNNGREGFPAVIFAGAFGFTPAMLLEVADAAQREAPKVSF